MPDFPIIVTPDGRSNARMLNALRSGRIRNPAQTHFWFVQRIRVIDLTLTAGLAHTITLATQYPRLPYPANTIRMQPYFVLQQTFSGGAVATCTFEFGDAGDPDGLCTATDVFTGAALGDKFTTGAAEYTPRPDGSLALTGTIRTTVANTTALTQGILDVVVGFAPKVKVA